MFRRRQSAIAPILLSALALCWACQPGYVEKSWSSIEVSDSQGEPVTDAKVTVSSVVSFGVPEGQIVGRPTDAAGITVVRIIAVGDRPYVPEFEVNVTHGDQSELLQIRNANGSTSQGSHFRLEVISDDEAEPEVSIEPDFAADLIRVDGYVGYLAVCDCNSNQVLWGLSGWGYVESAGQVLVPTGFEVIQGEECQLPAIAPCSEDYILVAYPGLSNDMVFSERFCIEGEFDLVPCDY